MKNPLLCLYSFSTRCREFLVSHSQSQYVDWEEDYLTLPLLSLFFCLGANSNSVYVCSFQTICVVAFSTYFRYDTSPDNTHNHRFFSVSATRITFRPLLTALTVWVPFHRTYWMAGLSPDPANFFKFLFILVLYSMAMTLFVSALPFF